MRQKHTHRCLRANTAWTSDDIITAAKAMPTTAHLQIIVRGIIPSFKTPHYSSFPLIAAKCMPEPSWNVFGVVGLLQGLALCCGSSFSKNTKAGSPNLVDKCQAMRSGLRSNEHDAVSPGWVTVTSVLSGQGPVQSQNSGPRLHVCVWLKCGGQGL